MCFTGAMFGLASNGNIDSDKSQQYLQLAEEMTFTCRELYRSTATHLGPSHFRISDQGLVGVDGWQWYDLAPEVVESYFYLWRLTHEQRYRDYAWDVVQAINQYCRTDIGFVGIRNTNDVKSGKFEDQDASFLGETLKYLYLIFSSDDLIPFSDWVFNSVGHPFPILSPIGREDRDGSKSQPDCSQIRLTLKSGSQTAIKVSPTQETKQNDQVRVYSSPVSDRSSTAKPKSKGKQSKLRASAEQQIPFRFSGNLY